MRVTSMPIDAPVALVEHWVTDAVTGRRCLVRTLVFNHGVVARPILTLLARLLHHV